MSGTEGSFHARLKQAKEKFKATQNKTETEGPNPASSKQYTNENSFSDLLSVSTTAEIMSEYLLFKGNLRNLLPSFGPKLIQDVRRHFKIGEVTSISSEDGMKFSKGQFPLLDALSQDLGICLRNILTPPTTICLLCEKKLTVKNKPVNVPLFTLSGPEMATKWMYQCRNCKSASLMRGLYESHSTIYYHIGNYY